MFKNATIAECLVGRNLYLELPGDRPKRRETQLTPGGLMLSNVTSPTEEGLSLAVDQLILKTIRGFPASHRLQDGRLDLACSKGRNELILNHRYGPYAVALAPDVPGDVLAAIYKLAGFYPPVGCSALSGEEAVMFQATSDVVRLVVGSPPEEWSDGWRCQVACQLRTDYLGTSAIMWR